MRRHGTIGLVILAIAMSWEVGAAMASTEEETFERAEARIHDAEARLRPDTEGWIRQKLAEARDVLEAARSSARQTGERHPAPVQKYSWSDAALKALWAESVAREVIFITTGELR